MKPGPVIRKTIFWLHLICGIAAGLVILIMSATGVILAYERQMQESADVPAVATPSAGAKRLSPEELLEKAHAATPSGASLSGLTVARDETLPATAAYGREASAYLDPNTGEKLEAGAPGMKKFFRGATELHRFLTPVFQRETGKGISGVSNLVFLFLVLSGLYLWFPRKWSWTGFRPVIWFRGKLKGKAREWNWHNVLGFWSSIPLFFIVVTGAVISYPWASNLLYTLTGNEPPPPGPPGGQPRMAGGPPGGEAREGGRGGREGREGGERREGEGRREGGGERRDEGNRPENNGLEGLVTGLPVPSPFQGLNAAWAKAEAFNPEWQTISLKIPATKEAVFTIAASHRGRPDLRATLTLDPKDLEKPAKVEAFADQNAGRRLRTWSRWVHTGEAGGIVGQTIAAVASAAAVVLVWTGFALSIRRFARKLRTRKTAAVVSAD